MYTFSYPIYAGYKHFSSHGFEYPLPVELHGNIISIESDKIYQLPKNKICDYYSFVPTTYNFITSDFKTDQSISNSSALSSRFPKKKKKVQRN